MDATHADELSSLREFVTTLQGALHSLQAENKLLRQQLQLFIKRYFGGTKNESLDRAQLELLLAGLEAVTPSAPVVAPKTPVRSVATTRPVRQALPAHLETERVVLEPAEVQAQPAGWRKLGEGSPRDWTGSRRRSSSGSTSGPSRRMPSASSSRLCRRG